MAHVKIPPMLSPVGSNDLARAFEKTDRGNTGLGVYIQSQVTEPLEVPFLTERGTFTLASPTTVDSYTFTASAGHGILVGEVIELANTVTFMQAHVLAVVGDLITIDTLTNHAYTTGGTVGVRSSDNLLVDGSASPVIFSIKPEAGQRGDFNVFSIEFQSAGSDVMDFSTFGGRVALPRGLLFRVKREGGDFRNFLTVKSNGDFIRAGTDPRFLDPKGGNTNNGFAVSIVYGGPEHRDVAIRVDGDFGEEIQVVVQDNLTINNIKLHITAQGSELQAK